MLASDSPAGPRVQHKFTIQQLFFVFAPKPSGALADRPRASSASQQDVDCDVAGNHQWAVIMEENHGVSALPNTQRVAIANVG